MGLFGAAKGWPRSDAPIEVDVFMMPGCIREGGERPSLAYDMLVFDTSSGMILDTQVLDPRPGLSVMWGSVAAMLLGMLARVQVLPSEVRVHSPLHFAVLQALGSQLGFTVALQAAPAVDKAREEMLSWFRG